VVDDVMTTGATLQEMALMLKRHGAARVTNFVFVRTLPK
jgi:predicted amidophosphoribosyltransferase